MYHQYFGFTKSPFSIAPDPHNLFMSQQHLEALAHLLYGATAGGGFVLLTGEIGTGKTTLCRCLLEQLPKTSEVAFIFNPKLSALELLQTVCEELHIELPGGSNGTLSTKVLVDHLNAHLLKAHAEGRNTLLIIDEAQNLSADVLEQMRLLTNLETTERKLLQIILLGQPELRDKLAQPELAQLAQRVVARFHLGPLSKSDLPGYIAHRVANAGGQRQVIPPSLMPALHRASRGVPRLVNLICDRALLGAYAESADHVNRKMLDKAVREVRGDEGKPSTLPKWALGIAGLVGLAVLAATAYPFLPSDKPPMVASASTSASTNVDEPRKTAGAERAAYAVAPAQPVATALPVLPVAAEPAQKPINAGSNASSNPSSDPNSSAWKALFDRWGLNYRADSLQTTCDQAQTAGLRCLQSNGSLQELRELNQPVILQLQTVQGLREVALVSLSSTTATIVSQEGSITRAISEVSDVWTGGYTLLWRAPSEYAGVMELGDRGGGVLWLRRQLVQLGHLAPTAQSSDQFDDNLVQQVLRFQRNQGMRADGKVGPRTVMRLMAAADSRIPQLSAARKDQ